MIRQHQKEGGSDIGKNAKKRLIREFGGDNAHNARIVDKQKSLRSSYIESKGGAEALHKRHASCLTAAKPKIRGKITKLNNPYCGSYITDMGGYYFISLTTNKGKQNERQALKHVTPQLGGFMFTLNGIRGYVIPQTGNENFIRSLSVKWGV